jgi:hypothetical protein
MQKMINIEHSWASILGQYPCGDKDRNQQRYHCGKQTAPTNARRARLTLRRNGVKSRKDH